MPHLASQVSNLVAVSRSATRFSDVFDSAVNIVDLDIFQTGMGQVFKKGFKELS